MDALKSYFTKMKILPGQGQKSWRFNRKGVGAKNGKGKYGRSKSQNDAGYESPSSMDMFEGKENLATVSQTGTLVARDPVKDLAKSPPAKPPRRDQIFTLDFIIIKGDIFGIELGNTAGSTCLTDSAIDRLKMESSVYDSLDDMSYNTLSPVKVTNIADGSIVQADGGIQLYDEIIDINGQAVQGESINGAR